MTFWEFSVACDGFETFHAAPSEDAATPPDEADFWAALGLNPPT